MNKKVRQLYGLLIDSMKPKYGNTHGLFVTCKGSTLPDKHVLFVGRETNGLGGATMAIYSSPPADYNVADTTDGDIAWLKDGYPYSSSPFWRVIGKSASRSSIDYNVDVFNSISWANLYRVAKCEKGGRITRSEKNDQLKLCSELMIEEIKEIKPSAIVFLTDEWWLDPFFDEYSEWEKKGYIKNHVKETQPFFVGTFDFDLGYGIVIPAIVVPHPQNKQAAIEEELITRIVGYVKPLLLNKD